MLSYDGSKCVMQYMEPNLRFILSQRCLSLSTRDKLVPIRIQTLQIDSVSIKVNGTTYTTKDILIHNKALTMAAREMNSGLPAANFPPSKQCITLMIKSDDTDETVLVGHKDKTAEDAMEHLIRKLFENKKSVLVTTLIVDPAASSLLPDTQRLRAPLLPLAPGTLSVRHLKTKANLRMTIDSLEPIMSTKPLKCLESCCPTMPRDFYQDRLVTSCEQLILLGCAPIYFLSKFPANLKIHSEMCFSVQDHVDRLMNSWKSQDIVAGKRYSIGYANERRATFFLESFGRQPGAKKKELVEIRHSTYPECVIVPVKEHLELKVYCTRTQLEDQKFCEQPYIGKIEIQPRGFSDNL